MTEIEILSVTERQFRCAFYYSVPAGQQLPDAADPARSPSGTRLSALELIDLKDGKLFELVRSIEIPDSFTPAQVGAHLIENRSTMQAFAAGEYKARFSNTSFVGKAYNGSSWS